MDGAESAEGGRVIVPISGEPLAATIMANALLGAIRNHERTSHSREIAALRLEEVILWLRRADVEEGE